MHQKRWKIPSLDIYKDMYTIAAIYNANTRDEKKTIEIFCEETGHKPKTANGIYGKPRHTCPADKKINDWDVNEQAIMEDIIPDRKGSLNQLVWNHW